MALLGVNDLFWFSTLAPSVVADEMAAFVDYARAGKSTVRLVLVGLPSTRGAQTDATLAGRVAEYNQRLSGPGPDPGDGCLTGGLHAAAGRLPGRLRRQPARLVRRHPPERAR